MIKLHVGREASREEVEGRARSPIDLGSNPHFSTYICELLTLPKPSVLPPVKVGIARIVVVQVKWIYWREMNLLPSHQPLNGRAKSGTQSARASPPLISSPDLRGRLSQLIGYLKGAGTWSSAVQMYACHCYYRWDLGLISEMTLAPSDSRSSTAIGSGL